ncbi:ATP-binding protein [Tumebacillus sp. ITR2]|uniref:ATP-binding protein n=1 Tax=Tumebacillus amylolyticus TaxID=2801339 RepID=A0ABS1J4Y3_9BACL|nr:ATP-binding protein [Tumebacillus amylolyticus]MBL0385334.1 ATP-binding protein [Tumebacillus amylolyticus]
MKITHFYSKNAGPQPEIALDFRKPHSGQAYPYLLISGPNGTGKSFLLFHIQNLWSAAECCITDSPATWTSGDHNWKNTGLAIIIDSPLNDTDNQVGLFIGSEDVLIELQSLHPNLLWLGQIVSENNPSGTNLSIPEEHIPFVQKWLDEHDRLILTPEKTLSSNLIYLDAEQRRWVAPKKNVGSLIPDDYRIRWLCTYEANENWRGQLEAGLINLKIVDEKNYKAIIRDMNKFLINKQIDPQIHRADRNRLRVVLNDSSKRWHYLDELSAGERQVLIMIYIISRWMEEGGVVLLDEPDLHLHPSLVKGLLGQLESLVSQRNGQLIITSHHPDVWDRYKAIGKRIRLGEPEDSQETVDEELESAVKELEQWLEEQGDGKMD